MVGVDRAISAAINCVPGGGKITVKLIPGEGHKASPSFLECQELVDFVIAQGAK